MVKKFVEIICAYCGKKTLKNKYYVTERKKKGYTDFYCCAKHARLDKIKIQTNEIIIEKNYAKIKINSPKYGLKFVLIDIEDIEKIKNIHWFIHYYKLNNSFYADSTKNDKLHRYITNCPKNKVIDHINHNTLDNRKFNLRICTRIENNRNKKNNTSGHVGVYWDKTKNKWTAQIMINYKTIFIGRYEDINDAIQARKEAEKKYFGYTQ